MTLVSRRWLNALFGLAVTGFFVWLLLRQLDLSEVSRALSGMSPLELLVALCFLAVGYSVRVFRWWWMLRALDPEVPLSACGWPFLVSIALNNLLPFRAGDAVRVVGFRKELRSPAMRLFGTLFIERLLDLMTLLALFFVGLLGVADGAIPEHFVYLAMWIAGAGLFVLLSVLLFSKWIEQVVHRVTVCSYFNQRGWSEHLQRHSSHFLDALQMLRTPSLTISLILLSGIVWLFEGAVFAIVAHGLHTQTGAGAPWFALSTGTLATLLPSSPGYVGTFDYFTMLGLLAYGADRDHAAAFAVTVHLVLWLPLTVVGLIYFIRPGARMLRRKVTYAMSSQEESK